MELAGNNYTVGRGKLYFSQFAAGTLTPQEGEKYFGNTPSLATNQNPTNLDHYSSDEGLKVKDLSVQIQNDMNLTFTTDNINRRNVALWFLGEEFDETEAGSVGVVEAFTVQQGFWYQLGIDTDHPAGVILIENLVASGPGVAATGSFTFGGQPTDLQTITIGTDVIVFADDIADGDIEIGVDAAATAAATRAYINAHSDTLGVTALGATNVVLLTAVVPGTAGNAIALAKSGTNPTVSAATLAGGGVGSSLTLLDNITVDEANGRFYVEPGGAVPDDALVTVTYDVVAGLRTGVIAGGSVLYGQMRFISANPVGPNWNYYWPYVALTSNGDLNLKGDEWQVASFAGQVLKLDEDTERVYIQQR